MSKQGKGKKEERQRYCQNCKYYRKPQCYRLKEMPVYTARKNDCLSHEWKS